MPTSSHLALRADNQCLSVDTASGWHLFIISWPMFSVSLRLASCLIKSSSNFYNIKKWKCFLIETATFFWHKHKAYQNNLFWHLKHGFIYYYYLLFYLNFFFKLFIYYYFFFLYIKFYDFYYIHTLKQYKSKASWVT